MAAVFAIGAPIFVNRVEDDLEARTVAVLNAAGVGPVDVHFSGQDGELRCVDAGPVEIPDDVLETIGDLRGVSSIDVAANCSNGDAADPDDATDADAQDDTDVSSTAATTGDSSPPDTDDSEPTTAANPDLLTDVIAGDSQFSTLAGLIGDADLTELLSGDGPYTVFAPTNAAFESLGADVIGALARDVDLLAAVLTHHVADGTMLRDDFVEGPIEMIDGTSIDVEIAVDSSVLLSSGEAAATVAEADLVASNGVVHAIDQVLVSDDITIDGASGTATTEITLADGQVVLSGVVASEAQRAALVESPGDSVDEANVVDELDVDEAQAVSDATAAALAVLAEPMVEYLASGSAVAVDDTIAVTGTYATEADRDAFLAASADLDGVTLTTELDERPIADAAAAADVEVDLNSLVAAQPILFDPSSTTISDVSLPTIDRVAGVAGRVGGVTIVVEGYTDTDGLADSNQALSEGRARAVRDALIARGLPDSVLSIVGFGGTDPIVDASGVEDKAASRRVEFVVAADQ